MRMLIGALLGGLIGYGYYRLVGCSTGACPITSNPYITITYGAIVGIVISLWK